MLVGFQFKLLPPPLEEDVELRRGEELLVGTLTTKSRLTTKNHFIVCSTLLEQKRGGIFYRPKG
jgi:hypothetical protein